MTTLIGIGAGFICVIISIMLSGKVMDYYDGASIFITIGGTIFAMFASFPLPQTTNTLKALKKAFSKEVVDQEATIEELIRLAGIARKEGVLALEETAKDVEDPFLKKGIMLIVDGTDPELIKDILETDLAFVKSRHAEVREVLDAGAGYAPAFGMIGTLIGLVNMLQSLEDMSSLGKNMAVALITTFYGSVLANLVFSPLSKKLKAVGAEEYLLKEIMMEGLISIQNGENPRIIREKLNAFRSVTEIQQKVTSSDQ